MIALIPLRVGANTICGCVCEISSNCCLVLSDVIKASETVEPSTLGFLVSWVMVFFLYAGAGRLLWWLSVLVRLRPSVHRVRLEYSRRYEDGRPNSTLRTT